ncbi:transposase [Streptomyces decoyicus]|uniref:transposase n=1 Tax=Streptomyces decoyicus TaxID=249567 RepID=UPI002E18F379|nr:transposase [Streptomyces decoyicus]WSV45346.1 transposase [Streptomyces decoyicus]
MFLNPRVITTAANVNDVTQTLALVDGIPPIAGRTCRPRRRPEALLGDKGYDSNPNRDELRKRRILPLISRKGAPNIKGLGKLRYVVEQTFALLHHFKRLAAHWERRTELRDALASLTCGLICRRRLEKTGSCSCYELCARRQLSSSTSTAVCRVAAATPSRSCVERPRRKL